MTLNPIKTHDVVWYQGQQHLVKSINMAGGEIMLDLAPLSQNIKTVSYKDVNQPVEKNIRYLVASKIAQRTFVDAYREGLKSSKTKSVIMPLEDNEIRQIIYSDIKRYVTNYPDVPVTQKSLDDIVSSICHRQGYLLAQYHRNKVKSNLKNYATWQNIANFAVKIANTYNRKLISSGKIFLNTDKND